MSKEIKTVAHMERKRIGSSKIESYITGLNKCIAATLRVDADKDIESTDEFYTLLHCLRFTNEVAYEHDLYSEIAALSSAHSALEVFNENMLVCDGQTDMPFGFPPHYMSYLEQVERLLRAICQAENITGTWKLEELTTP